MAEFTLPKNSKITRGREWQAEAGTRLKTFKIYRYDPIRAPIRATTSTPSTSTKPGRWSSTR